MTDNSVEKGAAQWRITIVMRHEGGGGLHDGPADRDGARCRPRDAAGARRRVLNCAAPSASRPAISAARRRSSTGAPATRPARGPRRVASLPRRVASSSIAPATRSPAAPKTRAATPDRAARSGTTGSTYGPNSGSTGELVRLRRVRRLRPLVSSDAASRGVLRLTPASTAPAEPDAPRGRL